MEIIKRHSLIGLIISLTAVAAVAQTETRTRSITSDAFAGQRPSAQKPSGGNGQAPAANTAGKGKTARTSQTARRKTYRLQGNKPVVRRNGYPAVVINSKGRRKVSEVGVTFWKMRPAAVGEQGYRIPVVVGNRKEYWVADRTNGPAGFSAGDKVRLAFESSAQGYLYVVNSEYYTDGTYGQPTVLFPSSADDDNFVVAGQLVDIPDQSENLPYFNIEPHGDKYAGELITFIISPVKLTGLKIDANGRIENVGEYYKLEAAASFDIYSRNDNTDKTYTQAEADSACGARTRQLVRDKSEGKPCGAASRQLTREEPLPQTIYRINAAENDAAVAFVKIAVKKK